MTSDVLELFLELAALPSPPGRGARRRRRGRRAISATAASRSTRTAPARRPARRSGTSTPGSSRRAEGEPLLLCAHLDTVPPTAAIEPVVEDGVVRNGAGTILGADNKAAVAVDARGDAARARRGPPARRHRAAVHAEGGGRARRRVRLRPHAACTRGRATSTTRRRRSAPSSSARRSRSRSR